MNRILKYIIWGFSVFFSLLNVHAQLLPEHLELGTYSGEPKIQALKSIRLTNGFHATGNVLISIAGYPNMVSTASTGRNFVLTRTFRSAGVTMQNLNVTRPVNEENRLIQYYDEKGRLSQTVEVMGSPSYADVITHSEYDGFGRESIKYLPYVETKADFGNFRVNARVNQRKFYSAVGTTDSHVNKTDFPFSRTVIERSPLSRMLESGAEGESWQPAPRVGNQGHTTLQDQGVNTSGDQVKLWVLNGQIGAKTEGRYHAAGSLYKITAKDENWKSGKAGTIEEFKNLEGKVLLKRSWKTESESFDTYYIYSDFGDLCYVVPPKYKDITLADNSSDFDDQIYAYKYDKRRRAIKKKVPGRGWEYMVYNDKDQIVYSRDARQLEKGEWNFIKYDALGRIVMTGIVTGHTGDNQSSLIASLENLSIPTFEARGTAAEGYTNNALPTISTNTTILTVNYYDSYTGIPSIPVTNHTGYSSKIQELLTASKTKVLGSTEWLWTVNHYDDKAQIVNVHSTNHLGGTDNVTNEYSFVGELVKSSRVHVAKGISTTLVTTNKFDHVGRQEWAKMQVTGQPEVMVSKNEYNEVGQLKKRSIGGTATGDNFVSSIDYKYNPRGWLTESNAPQFSLALKYDAPTVAALAQYNGNISQQDWTHQGLASRSARYSYDKLNRLTEGNADGYMREQLEYDEIGSIRWMKRDGAHTDYVYENNGKSGRLSSLTGALAGNYTYDANGNATKDRTGMTFSYNHLNLPASVSGNGANVTYLYSADGVRLRKTSSTLGVRDYVGGIEYGTNGIERIAFSDGYLLKSGSSYVYYYHLSDHLNNIRAVVYRNPSNNAVEAVQQQDYYAFGKTKQLLTGGNNKYLYNGKEVQEELGNQLDYGARFYDPEIGRWNVVDPKYDLYYSTSPYAYVMNNPVYNVDVNGEFAGTITGAITGAIMGAVQAYLSDADLTPSIVKGALAGAVGGATFDFTVATVGTGPVALIGAGVIAGVAASAAEQYMESGTVSIKQAAIAGALGGAAGYAGSKAAPYIAKGATAVAGYMESQVAKTLAPAATEMVESFSNMAAKSIASSADDLAKMSASGKGIYIPSTPLAQQKVAGWDIPLPDPNAGAFPHTTLGGKIGSDGILYRQSATFTGGTWPLANGQAVPWSRVDWTTHGRPLVHPSPHQHIFNFNNGKNWSYGSAVSFP